MPRKGKRYSKAVEQIDRQKTYELEGALAVLKEFPNAKFDETVDIAVRLGVNPKHADQMVRGSVVLPNGLGKAVRVLVFAKGEKEREATEAGADYVGSDDLVEKIKDGWLEFDRVVATPDMMGTVGKLGKILGPRGLMPNPKVGTVTFDVKQAVEELKAGQVEFRTEKAGIVHSPVGKVSFGTDKLVENILVFVETINRLKPASSKGTYLKNISLAATMGPGIKVDTIDVRNSLRAA